MPSTKRLASRWIVGDFGIPSIRFHIEAADRAQCNAQFVFPLGIVFAT